MKVTCCVLVGLISLAGAAMGRPGGEFSVAYLSLAQDGSVGQVPCENDGELICATSVLEGDWTGTAKVRFTEFLLNPMTGVGTYSGEIDICVEGIKNGGETNYLRKSGCTTGEVVNGNLAVAGLTEDFQPIFAVSSQVKTSGGTGYFKKLECETTNTGSIDPSRAPYGEMLDFAITCSFNPELA
jgi:hypothetical protein